MEQGTGAHPPSFIDFHKLFASFSPPLSSVTSAISFCGAVPFNPFKPLDIVNTSVRLSLLFDIGIAFRHLHTSEGPVPLPSTLAQLLACPPVPNTEQFPVITPHLFAISLYYTQYGSMIREYKRT